MKKKTKELKWPQVTLECPEGVEVALLRYWIDLWEKPQGYWTHPDDLKKQKKYIKAANTLLEFFD